MSNPKVSICIPTYNHAQFLGECLRSALGQTYHDFEVVLSINHCTDNTEDVVREFANDPRLRVVRPEQFLSSGENFRFVIAQARGEYVNFLSSDDLLYPDFLLAQVETLERSPNVAFSFTAGELIDEHGLVLQINRPLAASYVRSGRKELERYIISLRATGIALLVRRSVYDRIGGLTTEIVDWEVCVKLLCHGDVAYCSRILAQVRIWSNEGRVEKRVEIIRSFARFFDDCERYVTRLYPELEPNFRKARTLKAQQEILGFAGYGPLKDKALAYTLELSDAPSVRLQLFLSEQLRLGPVFRGYKRADLWLRLQAKKVLAGRLKSRVEGSHPG